MGEREDVGGAEGKGEEGRERGEETLNGMDDELGRGSMCWSRPLPGNCGQRNILK